MRRIAVIGMGTMGPGMAARLARGGLAVAVHDVSETALQAVTPGLDAANAALDALGIVAEPGGRVELHSDLGAAVEGAELVIENVPETVELKGALYRQLAPMLGEHTILASDTSGIPITQLAQHVAAPARFVGMHWSNPPHLVPMIEVVSGEKTSVETADAIRTLIRSLGLLPVTLKRDVPGFVENRVLYALLREVIDLVETGVIEPEDIDTCVRWGIGYKLSVIGPTALLDMAGLDIYRSVASYLNAELCDRSDVAPLVRERVAEGALGIKSGRGFYDYGDAAELAALRKQRAAKLIAVRKALEA